MLSKLGNTLTTFLGYQKVMEWKIKEGKVSLFNKNSQWVAEVFKEGVRKTIKADRIGGCTDAIFRSAKEITSYFKDTYIKLFPTSDGSFSLRIEQRLKGGVDSVLPDNIVGRVLYLDALSELQENLKNLINPFVLQQFQDLIKVDVAVTEEIITSAERERFPDVLWTSINNFCRVYKNLIEKNYTENHWKQIYEVYKRDIKNLRSFESSSEFPLWPELELFLSLSAIKKLNNEKIAIYYSLIKEKNVQRLRETVKEDIGDLYDNLEEGLQKYGNLNTLISQIVKKQPKEKKKLSEIWKNGDFGVSGEEIAFYGRNGSVHVGKICELSISYNSIEFSIENGLSFQFSKENGFCNYLIFRKVELDLINTVLSGKLIGGEIRVCKNSQRVTGVESGTYELRVNKHVVGDPVRHEVKSIELFNKKLNYKIEIKSDNLFRSNGFVNLYEGKKLLEKKCSYALFSYYQYFEKSILLDSGDLSLSDLDKIVSFSSTPKDREKELRILNSISNAEGGIKKLLSAPEKENQLEKIIRNYIENKLESIDILVVDDKEIIILVKTIVDQFKELDVNKSVAEVLINIASQVNYHLIVQKNEEEILSGTVELLREGQKFVELLENKRVILFLGNTGSGKSTTINYLLGRKCSVKIDHIGIKNVEVPNADASSPKISRSYGVSETVHIRGYSLPKHPYLCDCPGFKDTRGKHYQLCASLNLGRVINKVNSIAAVVITIPIQLFSLNKGEGVIELVEEMRESFPEAFFSDKINEDHPIHILITKGIQVPPETVNGFENLIRELSREAQARLRKIANRTGEVFSQDIELEVAEKRAKIWKAIEKMQDSGKIDIVDVLDNVEKDELVEKYESVSLDKSEYYSPLNTSRLKKNFEDYILSFSHTWLELIFKKYLNTIPDEIKRLENAFELTIRNAMNAREKKNYYDKKIVELNESIYESEALVKDIDNALRDSGRLENNARLKEEILDRCEKQKSQFIAQIAIDIERENEIISKLKGEIEWNSAVKEQLEDMMRKVCLRNDVLKESVREMSNGEMEEELANYDFREKDRLPIATLRKFSNRKKALKEMSRLKEDLLEEKRVVQDLDDFTGDLYHQVNIDRAYKIVPSDPIAQKEFKKRGVSGAYVATVEGKHYKKDFEKISMDGKKISYGFVTKWRKDQRERPWFRIKFNIPKVEFFSSSINNAKHDLKENKLLLQKALAELDRYKTLEEEKKRELNAHIENQNELSEKHFLEQERSVKGELGAMREEIIERLSQLRKEIEELKVGHQLEELALIEESKAAEIRKSIGKLKQEKQRLALAVQTHKDVVLNLRDFTDLAMSIEARSARANEWFVKACKDFNNRFDDPELGFGRVIEESTKDLNLMNY